MDIFIVQFVPYIFCVEHGVLGQVWYLMYPFLILPSSLLNLEIGRFLIYFEAYARDMGFYYI